MKKVREASKKVMAKKGLGDSSDDEEVLSLSLSLSLARALSLSLYCVCVCVCVKCVCVYNVCLCVYIHRVWTTRRRSGYSVHIHRVYVHT